MDSLTEMWRRLRHGFRRRAFDRDLDDEIRLHLDMKAEANRAAGMTAGEARYAARRQFGNATLLAESSRDAWGWRWLDDLAHDLRFALRTLRRNPGFAAVAVLTLALGIGANTAMFGVLYGTCLAPLPYAGPDRLVDVSLLQTTGRRFDNGTSLPNLRDWRAQSRSFEGLGVHRQHFFVNLTGDGEAEEVHSWRLSADLLRLLGVPPLAGRWFVPEEDVAAGPRSALIAHELWQSRFGGDPHVLGKRVFVDGEAFTIVGVMPPRFAFPPMIGSWNPVIWLSLNLPDDIANARGTHSLSVVGRLRPGTAIREARTEMEAIAARLAKAYPSENGDWPSAKISLLRDWRGRIADFRSTLWVLFGAAGLVLLIACANTANLLLARGAAREREFAIRRALGVTRPRLARQLLTESFTMAGAGAAAGVLLAYWSLPSIRSLLEGKPRAAEIAISPAVLFFTAGVAALTSLLFGLAPALRQIGRPGAPRRRLGMSLVAGEIAIAVLLLSAAALLIESLWRATHVDLGYRPDSVLTARVNLPKTKYSTGRRVEAFREDLVRRVSAIPGVKFAGTNSAPPLGVLSQGTAFEIEGSHLPGPQKPFAGFANVSADYLRAMGIPLLRGRHFLASDRPDSLPVAIISESVARQYFAGEEPLGRGLRLERLDASPVFTIIGVVKDVRERPETPATGTIYALSSQLPESAQGDRPARFIVLAVRTATDPGAIARALRRAVSEIDKDQPVAAVTTMRQAVGKALAGRTLNTLVFGLFAGLALSLAAVGVFGLVSYSVARRTNEIGIRMALGARPPAILGMVVGEMLRPAAAGVAAGVAASLAGSRLMASMVYGVKPAAPHVLLAAVACLVSAVLVATVLAARRAMRLDPVAALRRE